jgi:hypothetical protein
MKPWPYEYYSITPALLELQRRYPWPSESPNLPFDRRRWFDGTHMRSILDLLPKGPLLILEIGSYLGASLRFMMEASPASFFVAVDPLSGSIPSGSDRTVRVPFKDMLISNC